MPRKRTARCPACKKPRSVDEQQGLLQVETEWFKREAALYQPESPMYPLEGGMRKLAVDGTGRWFWACDECLRKGSAIRADITRQNLGMGTPFAAYVDRPFRCADCGTEAVFAASEQKHWFEKLGFLIWVYPKACAPCRSARRRQKEAHRALADALHGLDPSDADQLGAIALLYDEIGSERKADEYRARARNRENSRK